MKATTSHPNDAPNKNEKKRRRRPEIEVVECGTAFPISKHPRRMSKLDPSPPTTQEKPKYLDWNDVSEEVRHLGSTGFNKKDKRTYEKEQYKELTGRDKKQQHVPLPILRGIRKKAKQREERHRQECMQAGIVLPNPKKKPQKEDRTSYIHGPAPSIGFVNKGVYNVPKKR